MLAEDDGTVRISLNSSRQKTKNLLASPVVDLLILDLAGPHRYLELRGDAAVEPDPDYVFADRVGAKYGGADLRKMDKPGEQRYVVTINPSRMQSRPSMLLECALERHRTTAVGDLAVGPLMAELRRSDDGLHSTVDSTGGSNTL